MRFSQFFISRPIFAIVISVFITIVGGLAALTLPVAQYPQVVPPTVQVTARYPGASAETIAQTVATPLEQQINGVEGMLYLSSQATGNRQPNYHRDFRGRLRSGCGPGASTEPSCDCGTPAARTRAPPRGHHPESLS